MASFADLARLPSSDVFMDAVKEHSVLSVGLAVGVSTVLVVRYLRSPWRIHIAHSRSSRHTIALHSEISWGHKTECIAG